MQQRGGFIGIWFGNTRHKIAFDCCQLNGTAHGKSSYAYFIWLSRKITVDHKWLQTPLHFLGCWWSLTVNIDKMALIYCLHNINVNKFFPHFVSSISMVYSCCYITQGLELLCLWIFFIFPNVYWWAIWLSRCSVNWWYLHIHYSLRS